jgi:hypothetical protein
MLIKGKEQLIKHKIMKTCGEVAVKLLIFSISSLDGDEWSALFPSQFISGDMPPST